GCLIRVGALEAVLGGIKQDTDGLTLVGSVEDCDGRFLELCFAHGALTARAARARCGCAARLAESHHRSVDPADGGRRSPPKEQAAEPCAPQPAICLASIEP